MGKRVQKLALKNLASKVLNLGYVGENEHTQIVIDCSEVLWDYEDAVTSVVVQPPRGDMYPVEVTREDDSIIWEIADSDLVYSGTGRVQITFTNDGEVVKSAIGNTKIEPSIMATGTAPTPLENWMERAEETARQMGQDVADATLGDLAETKAECIAEIEQAGEDTRATIPADYTQMSDDVTSLKSAIVKKAEQAGVYPELTAGTAEQLASSQYAEDNAAYTIRATGGVADVGNREYLEKIIGGTVCWNQLVTFTQGSKESYDVTYTLNADGSVSVSGTATGSSYLNVGGTIHGINGHKVLLLGCPSGGSDATYYLRDGYTYGKKDVGNGVIISKENDNLVPQIVVINGTTVTDVVFKPQFFDLTAMFGPTIADYIYGLEQATAGAGVAWFRRYFPNDYYAYNPGELISVMGLQSHDTVGFNLWDEEWELGSINSSSGNNTDSTSAIRSKNYISVIPGARYYIKTSGKTLGMRYYDADKKYLTYAAVAEGQRIFAPNVRYIRFYVLNTTVYNHDICIHLAHSGTRNDDYEPYEKHSYPLDSTLTLRGMPKLDENGGLVYDGDEYTPDGNVKRKYKLVNLGSLNWNKGSENATRQLFWTAINDIKVAPQTETANMMAIGYTTVSSNATWVAGNISMNGQEQQVTCTVGAGAYADAAAFKAAMDGVYFLYELAAPTTEQAEPYTEIQVCSDWGTEEFVSDSILPVGHLTRYPANLRDKLQHLPSLADADGDYIVRQSGSQMSLVGLGNTNEITGIKDDISELRATASAQGIYVDTESQPIVSVSDGADDQPMKAVKVAIEPVQDLHGYDAPWPDGGGKNLLDPSLLIDQASWFVIPLNVKPNTQYTCSTNKGTASDTNLPLYFNNTGTAGGSSATAVSSEYPKTVDSTEAGIVYVTGRRSDGTDSFANYIVQVEESSTATELTPYSNICPISGWTGAKVTRTGKNLLDISRTVGTLSGSAPGTQRSFEFDKYYIGMSGNNYYYPNRIDEYYVNNPKGEIGITTGWSAYGVAFPIRVKPNTSYYITATAVKGSPAVSVGFFDKDGWYLSSKGNIANTAVTTPDKCTIMNIVVNGQDTNGVALKDLSINYPSEDHDYHEPHVDTYEVTFSSEAGTVYGGTLDVASGKLAVDRAMSDLGSLAWTLDSTSRFKTTKVASIVKRTTSNAETLAGLICEIYRAASNNNTGASSVYDNVIGVSTAGNLFVKDTRYSTVADFVSAVTGTKVVYPLATPQEITLTPTEIKTLLGVNNVWSDASNTAITYPADTKLYIDRKITEAVANALNA